jgi:Holliday junction resolvase RusA-like endonuclease
MFTNSQYRRMADSLVEMQQLKLELETPVDLLVSLLFLRLHCSSMN